MGKLVMGLLIVVLCFGSAFAAETGSSAAATAPVSGSAPAAREYNFGDMTSQTLATNAWQALEVKDFDAVYAYANKCIELYKSKALVMQASLTDFAAKGTEFDYWALNDVGTCYFIKGMALKEQGNAEEAKEAFNTVIKDLSYSQCWDTKGWFWKPAQGSKDQLKLIELKEQGKEYDFGDYTSMTLTVKAWEALDKKDYTGVEIYTRKCLDLYEEEAAKQQAAQTDYLPKEQAFNTWALNDVGTCYFILGEGLVGAGKYKEAKEAYSKIIDKFSFAQCWDPRGWFWKPAVGARGKINKIIAEHGV
jgi:tetratricopeptide (TPR) repeat protein